MAGFHVHGRILIFLMICDILKGTIQRECVILNHQLMKSKFRSRPCSSEQSDWSLRRACPLPITVPHVITSAADLFMHVQPPKKCSKTSVG